MRFPALVRSPLYIPDTGFRIRKPFAVRASVRADLSEQPSAPGARREIMKPELMRTRETIVRNNVLKNASLGNA